MQQINGVYTFADYTHSVYGDIEVFNAVNGRTMFYVSSERKACIATRLLDHASKSWHVAFIRFLVNGTN